MGVLDEVLADLAAEGDRLDAWLEPLTAQQWLTPTPAAGWDVATTVGHLAWTDEVVLIAATDPEGWDRLVGQAITDPDGFVDTNAIATARTEPAALLDRWRSAREAVAETLRTYPTGQRLPWFGPPMSPTSMATARFMETWAHGLDVADALGITPEPTDRIRHVAHLGVRTRGYAHSVHGIDPPVEEIHVVLRSPSGQSWEWGPDDATQSVSGSAYDFCLLVTRRRHRDDLDLTAAGPDAERWLDIAQAFAGPPGSGRIPSGGSAP